MSPKDTDERQKATQSRQVLFNYTFKLASSMETQILKQMLSINGD